MASRRREPRWVTRPMIETIHQAQLREHGGASGIRDEGLLDAALARPRNKWGYARKTDWAVLAAAYTFGLAKNHGFVDGNKRVAFLGAYVFLGLNGLDFVAPEAEVATVIEGVAGGSVTEAALVKWFRANIEASPK